jgi:hypothetical protein
MLYLVAQVISSNPVNTVLTDSYQYLSKTHKLSDLREYLYSRHSPAEARMLYARALVGRTGELPEKEKLVGNLNVRETDAAEVENSEQQPGDEIKCPTCPSGWADLIKFKPPQEIYDKFDEENANAPNVNPPPIWYVHEIEDAAGSKINLDSYSVTVTTLPEDENENQMTIDELFKYIRTHLDDLMDHNVARFRNQGDPDKDFTNEDNWETDNYYGVIKKFTAFETFMNTTIFDDLGVIVTKQTSNSWIFTTIHTPQTSNHAVSGHREFGFKSNPNGTYTIFIRGADIPTTPVDRVMQERIFNGAEALWNSVMDGIIEFVTNNSGTTGTKQVVSNQYNLE